MGPAGEAVRKKRKRKRVKAERGTKGGSRTSKSHVLKDASKKSNKKTNMKIATSDTQ